MSHKRNEALRHVQHSMHHVIAAGEGSDRAPDSCKLCPYYRPDFKFRTCLYAHCPYKKQVNVFRSTPEKWDIESLERRIQEAEAAEVNEMVRTAKVTPEQLAALLRQSATATPTPAALSAVGATFNKEDDSNEDDE